MGSSSLDTMRNIGETLALLTLTVSSSSACLAFTPKPPLPTTSRPSTTTTTPFKPSCQCGLVKGRKRIVGGQLADKNEYPWLVRPVRKKYYFPFCGGSLISSNTVLTAAHCKGVSVTQFRVHVGEHDVRKNDGEMKIDVSEWINHPRYENKTLNFDFAVLR